MNTLHQLMDMMRNAPNDGNQRVYSDENGMGNLLEADGSMPGAGLFASPRSMPMDMSKEERFSRKVFVGGLPPDIDEGKGRSGQARSSPAASRSRGNHRSLSTLRPVDCRLAAQAREQILLSSQGLRVPHLHLRTLGTRSDR